MSNTPRAIGAIELSSIGIGYQIEDQMLKAASVDLLIARTICSGKYLIVIGGAGVMAGTKNKHQDTGKKILSPALAAGGVIAAIKGKKVVDHLRKNAGEIGDYAAVLANVGRVGPGKSLARSRGLRGFVGKSMLHGLL